MKPIQLDIHQLLGFRIVATDSQQNLGGKIGRKPLNINIHARTEQLGGKIGGKVGVKPSA
jgi:hypothetical protein